MFTRPKSFNFKTLVVRGHFKMICMFIFGLTIARCLSTALIPMNREVVYYMLYYCMICFVWPHHSGYFGGVSTDHLGTFGC